MNWFSIFVIFIWVAGVLLLLLGLSLNRMARRGDDKVKRVLQELDSCKLKDFPDLQETKGQESKAASNL